MASQSIASAVTLTSCEGCGPGSAAYKPPDRRAMLARLVSGDVFHAHWPDSEASLICLVTSVSDTVIEARVVTTQLNLAFSRITGIETSESDPRPAIIDSIAPLPVAIQAVILGLDRKYRLERDPGRFKLTDDELRAILYTGSHYASNPI